MLLYSDLTLADLRGANLEGAQLVVTWANTICPDGSNSHADDGDSSTCGSNLDTFIYGP